MDSDRTQPCIPIEGGHLFRRKRPDLSLPAREVGSSFLDCVKISALRSDLSDAISLKCEAVSVVDDPVRTASAMVGAAMTSCQFSIGTWLVMSRSVSIVDNAEETLLARKRREAPIIEDQQIDSR